MPSLRHRQRINFHPAHEPNSRASNFRLPSRRRAACRAAARGCTSGFVHSRVRRAQHARWPNAVQAAASDTSAASGPEAISRPTRRPDTLFPNDRQVRSGGVAGTSASKPDTEFRRGRYGVPRSRHYCASRRKPRHGPSRSARSAKSFYSVELRVGLACLALNPARSQPHKAPNAIALPQGEGAQF
jgi:hypothetical protein